MRIEETASTSSLGAQGRRSHPALCGQARVRLTPVPVVPFLQTSPLLPLAQLGAALPAERNSYPASESLQGETRKIFFTHLSQPTFLVELTRSISQATRVLPPQGFQWSCVDGERGKKGRPLLCLHRPCHPSQLSPPQRAWAWGSGLPCGQSLCVELWVHFKGHGTFAFHSRDTCVFCFTNSFSPQTCQVEMTLQMACPAHHLLTPGGRVSRLRSTGGGEPRSKSQGAWSLPPTLPHLAEPPASGLTLPIHQMGTLGQVVSPVPSSLRIPAPPTLCRIRLHPRWGRTFPRKQTFSVCFQLSNSIFSEVGGK